MINSTNSIRGQLVYHRTVQGEEGMVRIQISEFNSDGALTVEILSAIRNIAAKKGWMEN